MYDKNLVHYAVITGIITNSEGKFLIVKRAEWEKAFPGKWTVPGGKVEVLDYALRERDTASHWYNVLEDVLRREVKEEVNLEIKEIGYVTSLVYVRNDKIPCLIISLNAEQKEGEVKLCDALTDYKWVNLEEAKDYELIEGIYEELKILDEKMKTGKASEWNKS